VTINGGTALINTPLATLILTMPGDVMDHLTATGRVTDMHDILQTEMINHRQRIVGVMVHIVPVPDLTRSPMPTAIMGNHPEAFAREKTASAHPNRRN
jgi:hypothetical protein